MNNFCVYCLIGLKFEVNIDILVSLVYIKVSKLYVIYGA